MLKLTIIWSSIGVRPGAYPAARLARSRQQNRSPLSVHYQAEKCGFPISTLRDGPSGLLRVRQTFEIEHLILRSAPQERVSKDVKPH
jgi:hypothetical protein